jgi:MFS superfamily sulfate permease-like transporter
LPFTPSASFTSALSLTLIEKLSCATYRELARHPQARSIPGILILRFDARLAFYNVAWFIARLHELERETQQRNPANRLHTVVIDCEGLWCFQCFGTFLLFVDDLFFICASVVAQVSMM